MERRSNRRFVVQMAAEVEIFTCGGQACESFKGVVETVDLSLCGLSSRIIGSSMDTDKSFSPALAYMLVGKEIKVSFCSSDITVWGKVVRFDPKNMLMAVIISKVSDIMGWRDFLSDAIYSCATR